MTEAEGALALAGRDAHAATSADLHARVQRARSAVAARAPYVWSDDIVVTDHPDLAPIEQRLRAADETTTMWAEGWQLGVVDLRRVCSLQPGVTSQEVIDRVASVDADDLVSIATVTLPSSAPTELPFQFDPSRNAWVVSAANPNLRIVGGFQAPAQPGVMALGFGVAVAPSFLQVAVHHGRHVLRDGYHRAFGLLTRGITHAPAFVRDFGMSDLGVSVGLFAPDIYLSNHPPLLVDFLDDTVAATVDIPVVQKMIVIQGLELTPMA